MRLKKNTNWVNLVGEAKCVGAGFQFGDKDGMVILLEDKTR